jgi:outer membrane protein assembly factor BamB
MTRLIWPISLLLAVGVVSAAPDAGKESSKNWLHWRGPSYQGYVEDDRVPLTWSETENVLWKTRLPGRGNSTPIVFGDRAFLTTSNESGAERGVCCVRVSDGKLLWHKVAADALPKEKTHAWNGYASPSCATDGKHVWAFFGTPGMYCYDVEGKLVWKKSLGAITSVWGTGASPFLHGDLVIQNLDNDGGKGAAPAALVGLDKATGEVRWTTPRDQGRGFGTPRLMTVSGGRVDLVLNGPAGVWGYDPVTGKERWRCTRSDPDEKEKFGEPIPVDDGQRMYVASGRPGPFQIVRLPGDGDVTKTHVVYQGRRRGRDVASPMLWQGRVYAVDQKAVLTCLDLKTGKELYTGPIGTRSSLSLASPIAVQGKLLWLLDDGTTVVVEPGPKLNVVRRNKLDGDKLDYGASPVVVDGRLLLRSQSHLYCVGKR